MMWYSAQNAPAMMAWMFLTWLLWVVFIGAGIWFIIRWVQPRSEQLTPLQILQQRYAQGEIDTPTYEQMREHLSNTSN